MSLPPLPEPINSASRGYGQLWSPLYTADHLREAQRAVAEEVVKLCEERLQGASMYATVSEARFRMDEAREIAAAIRAKFCAKGE